MKCRGKAVQSATRAVALTTSKKHNICSTLSVPKRKYAPAERNLRERDCTFVSIQKLENPSCVEKTACESRPTPAGVADNTHRFNTRHWGGKTTEPEKRPQENGPKQAAGQTGRPPKKSPKTKRPQRPRRPNQRHAEAERQNTLLECVPCSLVEHDDSRYSYKHAC